MIDRIKLGRIQDFIRMGGGGGGGGVIKRWYKLMCHTEYEILA